MQWFSGTTGGRVAGRMPIGKLAAAGLAAALILQARPVRAQESVRSVTLSEAIRLAEQIQPRVVQAAGAVRNADARVRSAWGAYLPSLSVSSTGSESYSGGQEPRIDPNTGRVVGSATNGSFRTSIDASVDLFTGFRRGAESRAARASRTAAEASLVDARFQQVLVTTNQFFDALAARQLVSVREASVRRAEEQLKVSIARLQAGAATRSDSLRSLVTLGNAQLARIQAEVDLAAAEANLARLIGEVGRVRALDDSSFYRVVTPVDTAALRAEIEARSPIVRAARADAEAAEASLKAAQSAYWPELTLSAGTSWNGNRLDDYALQNQRQVSLRLSWNLFNGFGRERQIAVQASAAELAEAEAAEAARQVQAELTAELAELGAARARIDIAQTSVTAAEEDLRVQQERYRLGAATIVDVLTSQEALNQAEVDVVNARFDYLRAKARLEALIGRSL